MYEACKTNSSFSNILWFILGIGPCICVHTPFSADDKQFSRISYPKIRFPVSGPPKCVECRNRIRLNFHLAPYVPYVSGSGSRTSLQDDRPRKSGRRLVFLVNSRRMLQFRNVCEVAANGTSSLNCQAKYVEKPQIPCRLVLDKPI